MALEDKGERTESPDLPAWVFRLLAVGLPLLLFLVHRGFGHPGDVRFFFDWYRAFAESPAFYRDGPGINYPILGVLWICLPARLTELAAGEPLSFDTFRLVLKLSLCAAEVALIFAARRLASALGSSRPGAAALLLYLLPSTWAMGAWFGQIDIVGSVLLLLAAGGAVVCGRSFSPVWLLISLAGLFGAMLTKQLTFFSVPGLAALLVFAVRSGAREGRMTRWHWALILASPLLWFVADPFLTLPDGYFSHLAFVLLGGGSSHGDVICASGANFWTLLYPGNPVSAVETLLVGVSVRTWGIVSYSVAQVFFLCCFYIEVRRQDRSGDRLTVMSYGVFLVGASNLAMVTLLTGTHERYLVHGVPFLFLGLLRFLRGGWWWRAVFAGACLVGSWAGLFALSTIHWAEFGERAALAVFRSTVVTSVLQLLLLAAVLAACAARLLTSRDRGTARRAPGREASP